MAVDFSQFAPKTTALSTDYLVGYDQNASGGEKKFTLSTIANAVSGIITPALVETPAFTGTFKNKVINGNFDIWQRGTSLTSGTGTRYLADRWTNGSATTTYTPSRQAFTAGQTAVPNEPAFFHRTVVVSGNTAGSNATLHQHIESVRTFAGKTVTLSFYAKTPTAPEKVAIEFYQYFGTGGSSAVSIPAGSFNLTSSWQKFTVTVNIPSISAKTIGSSNDDYLTVYFWFDAGSTFAARASNIGNQSGTFDIAEVQVEEGSVATPFEDRPIGTELALCQRYFCKTYNSDIVPGTASTVEGKLIQDNTEVFGSIHNLGWSFPVTMRDIPNVVPYSTVTGTANRVRDELGNVDYTVTGQDSVGTQRTGPLSTGANVTARTWLAVQYTADAEL